MRFTVSIDVALPRDLVVKLYEATEFFPMWRPRLVSCEPAVAAGSGLKLTYRAGGTSEATYFTTETVVQRALPERIDKVITSPIGTIETHNHFTVLGPEETRWESEVEIRFKSWFFRMLGWFGRKAIRQQAQELLETFQRFAEHGTDVRVEVAAEDGGKSA